MLVIIKLLLEGGKSMKRRAFLLPLVFVMLIGLVIVSCAQPTPGQPTPAPTAAKPIKIGAFAPMTGPNAQVGAQYKNAIMFRLEEANNQVAGRPIELVFKDEGGGDPAFYRTAVKEMVDMDKVDIIVGPFNTALQLAGTPLLASVPMVSVPYMPSVGEAAALKTLYKGWAFGVSGNGAQFCYPFGQYAANELKYKTASTVGADFVAGKAFIGSFVAGFESGGGTVVSQQWVPYGTSPDMAPFISAIKDADVAVVFLIPIDQQRFMKQYSEMGYFQKLPMLMPRAIQISEANLATLGDSVLGVKGELQYVNRLDNPANKKFVAAFQAKYNKLPDVNDEVTYVATSVALAGIEATKGDTTPESLRQAIAGLKLDTPNGPLSFTPDGFAILNTYVIEAKKVNGQFVWEPIKTFEQTRLPGS